MTVQENHASTAARTMMTLDQVMERLGCSRHTLWRLRRYGGLPVLVLPTGGPRPGVRVDPEQLERWILEHQVVITDAVGDEITP